MGKDTTLSEKILSGLCCSQRFSAMGHDKAMKFLKKSFSPGNRAQLEISALVFVKMCREQPGLTLMTVQQARECVIYLTGGKFAN